MRIETIKIKDFKGISSLEFNPKRINLIIGKNNTGKTSILESINLLFNSDEIRQLYPVHFSKIISVGAEISELIAMIDNKKMDLKIKKATESEILLTFKNDIISEAIKNISEIKKYISDVNIENIKDFKEELENKLDGWINPKLKTILFKEGIILIKDEKDKKVYYDLEFPKSMSELENISENFIEYLKKKFAIKAHTVPKFLLRSFLFGPLIYGSKVKPSDKKEVFLIKNLQHIIRDTSSAKKDEKIAQKTYEVQQIIKEYNLINNLERLDFDYVIFKDKNNTKAIPFSFLGDGFKALVGLLLSISSKEMNNKIVLLDEPEIHMHPGYILELIKFILKFSKGLDIQFFIVTHDIDFIDSLFSNNFSKSEQEYLEKELLVLVMGKLKNSIISKVLDYKETKDTRDQLLLDLRGV